MERSLPPAFEQIRAVLEKHAFPILLYLSVVLRLMLLPNPGFEADISFWKSWGLAARDGGIVWSYQNTNNNYPTPFAYVLGLMSHSYSIFADPHYFQEFWNNHNLLFLTIAKLPSVLADFGIAAIIFWIGKNAKRLGFPELPMSFYKLLMILYLLNPISLIDGAWWGQVDSIGVLIFLLAVVAALKNRPLLSGIIYMTAMMTKLQNMIYGPVFFFLLWQLTGYRGLIRAAAGAVLAFLGLNIEFLLAREMGQVITSLTVNYDYFPFLSLNAFNLWWIVAGANGMKISDKIMAVGITTAKSMGLFLFSGFYFMAMTLMAREPLAAMFRSHKGTESAGTLNRETVLYHFFTGLIIVSGAFFLFQTESHDRYAFPASVFLLFWFPYFLYFTNPKKLANYAAWPVYKAFLVVYALFSVIYFYNLHTALVLNYPQNGLPVLAQIVAKEWSLAASVLLIALFGLYVFVVGRKISWLPVASGTLLFAAFLALTNSALILKKPVSLSKLTPIVSEQMYGKRASNMPVNASLGDYKSWNPLSVQYAFYKKGIGTHSKSFHLYDLNRQFKKLSTDFGIDTEAGPQASVEFEIYGDNKLLYRSPKKGRYEFPGHAEVNIANVKWLGLVTTDAGDGIYDDHADWLNPLLYP